MDGEWQQMHDGQAFYIFATDDTALTPLMAFGTHDGAHQETVFTASAPVIPTIGTVSAERWVSLLPVRSVA